MRFKRVIILFVFFITCQALLAQPIQQEVKVIVSPDRQNWTYKTGEQVTFTVSVLKDGYPLDGVLLKYELGPEKMDPVNKDSAIISKGKHVIKGGTLKNPGFLRCIVSVTANGREYRGLATAGFEPDAIKPSVPMPRDFVEFWEKAKAEQAQLPMDPVMTLIPERSNEKVNVYHISFQHFRNNARLYGILCVPKKEGKYPAILKVPGAGVRGYNGDAATAEQGFITLEIGIHGVPVNMPSSVYTDLSASALNGYMLYNLDDRDRYYYKRVYLGCLRANDFLNSLPQYDGKNLGVTGGSQGGALSIITAALDSRVKFLTSYYPALSDMTGYLEKRAGGWPHMKLDGDKKKQETVAYYDVVNFARLLTVPGYYSWGFNDEVCPPTSIYAAYNVISAPKELYLSLETGHWTYPNQRDILNQWLLERLKGR